MVERVGKELELDAQRQRLVVLGDRLREQRQTPGRQTTDLRAEMQALVAGAHFDRARAQSLIDEKTGAAQQEPGGDRRRSRLLRQPEPGAAAEVRDRLVRRHGWFGRG